MNKHKRRRIPSRFRTAGRYARWIHPPVTASQLRGEVARFKRVRVGALAIINARMLNAGWLVEEYQYSTCMYTARLP